MGISRREAPAESSAGASSFRPRRRVLFAAALVLFLTVLFSSYQAVPDFRPRWSWLGAGILLVLPSLLLNGLELRAAGALVERNFGLAEAVRVSLLCSAANLLPLPGSILVRTEALRRKGATVTLALRANAAVGAGWLTVALTAAGLALLADRRWAGVPFTAAGGGVLLVMIRLAPPGPGRTRLIARICGIEALFVLVSAGRLYAVLHGLAINGSLIQATVLTVAGALASAAGLFPGGLGLRELLAGVLGPMIGLGVAAAALAASVDRILGLTVLACATAATLLWGGGSFGSVGSLPATEHRERPEEE